MDLTDEQWAHIETFLPADELAPTTRKGGRPWRPAREVMNGVLWILRTGAPWADLPPRYGAYATAFRRYQRWVNDGLLKEMLKALAEQLRDVGKIDLSEAFIDGTHAGAKRGALWLAKHDAARQPRSWQWQTAMAFLSLPGLQAVTAVSPPSTTVEDREGVRVAHALPSSPHPLRAQSCELPRLRSSRLLGDPPAPRLTRARSARISCDRHAGPIPPPREMTSR